MLTRRLTPLAKLDDARLAARAGSGDAAAFAALYDRHHASLLAFCRHMLGNRQDGEDALQQTFIRAHRAMLRGDRPDEPRAWLFAIARNRCRTMLAGRRDVVGDGEQQLEGVCVDGLTAEVQQRAELRELLADMGQLPEDQRAALLLTELRGFSHDQIAVVIDCPPQKVKALVFQARTHLLAEREARDTGCVEIRQQLEVARGGELRRGLLRRHLRRCAPCTSYSLAIAAQRNELGGLLVVVPSAALKASVLGAVGLAGADGVAGGAAAAAAGMAAGGVGGGGGSVSAAGAVASKLAAVKVAAVLAVGGTAVGGAAAIVDDGVGSERAAGERDPVVRTQDAPAGRPAAGTPISTAGRQPAGTDSRRARKPGTARRRARAATARRRARAATRVSARSRARIRRRARLRRARAGTATTPVGPAAPVATQATGSTPREQARRRRRAARRAAADGRPGAQAPDATNRGPGVADRRPGKRRRDTEATGATNGVPAPSPGTGEATGATDEVTAPEPAPAPMPPVTPAP